MPANRLVQVKLETDTDPPPGIRIEVKTLFEPFPVSIRVVTPSLAMRSSISMQRSMQRFVDKPVPALLQLPGMQNSTIRIPRPFQAFHGERASRIDVVLVYAAGIAFGVLALVFALSRVAELEWWKAALLFLVAMDSSGGVVACFTSSTDRYYARRPGLRWAFILVHVIEPAILYILFDGRLAYWCFLYAYTAAAASIVNVIKEKNLQETMAAALVIIGIVVLLPISLATPFLAWFGPVFMLKLILAFAVRRT